MGFAAAIGPVLGLVGAGVQFAAQRSAAAATERIAQYNYANQMANARMAHMTQMAQVQMIQRQSEIMTRQAEINFNLASHQAQARIRNAQIQRDYAEAQTRRSQENIRRQRDDYTRFKAMQRARIASSGVLETSGSPLELLAETAGQMQLALNEIHYQADLERREQYHRAAFEEFGGKMDLAGAQANLSAGLAEADLRMGLSRIEEAKATANFQSASRQADINRMVGQAEAQGQRYAAWGSLLSGVGGVARQTAGWGYKGVI